jgi:3D (Asp-Asp-Asp) domain-containing protein
MGNKILSLFTSLVVIGVPQVSLTPQAHPEKAFLPIAEAAAVPLEKAAIKVEKTLKVWVTAYSSTPEETDDTPFITAWNTPVRDGIVATNLLPFGSKIRIPELFGDKIFTVEDRMHRRKTDFVDVWMGSKLEALEFGISRTNIEVIGEPEIVLAK